MKLPIIIFILLLITSSQSSGQTLESKDVYKFTSKRYTRLPDSTFYKDSIDLNPFKFQENISQITIIVNGLEQKYRFDIKLSEADTIAFITAYTYEIKQIKPTREDKKIFPKYRIVEKEEWKLKTKLTAITDTVINSVLAIIETVNFDSLPNYEQMRDNIGLIQFDGHGFIFEIKREDYFQNYSVNNLYLNRHEKLKELQPIESLLLDYLKQTKDLKVQYLDNACYNSGSIIWICR